MHIFTALRYFIISTLHANTQKKHELHRFQGIVAPPFQGVTLNILPARKIFGKVIPRPFLISLDGLGGGQGRQAIYLASSNEDLHAIGLDWQGIVRSVSEMYFFGSIRKLRAVL